MKPGRRNRATKEDILAARTAIWPDDASCPLCGRTMVKGRSLNEHHLIPRMYGGVERYVMHKVCHSKLHSVFNEGELAHKYNTFEKLREHPQIVSFIKWVRKQDPELMTKHVSARYR
jgi:5-methylcytosine-specific restriction endonuclease McrA